MTCPDDWQFGPDDEPQDPRGFEPYVGMPTAAGNICPCTSHPSGRVQPAQKHCMNCGGTGIIRGTGSAVRQDDSSLEPADKKGTELTPEIMS